MNALISQLRTSFAGIDRIDPCGPTYPKLIALLGRLSQSQLKIVAAADIKFVSLLARNRIK